MRGCCFLTTATVVLLCGCQQVYWTNWEYQRIETKPLNQPVRLESEPSGATVLQDGRDLGRTPCEISVEYCETAALFQRQHIEQNGSEKRVLETQFDRRNVTTNPTPVALRFRRPHYLDAQAACVVPGQRSMRVKLDPVPYNWEIQTTGEIVHRMQAARIVSATGTGKLVEGAAVYLDGEQIGVTPFDYKFPYEETELVLKRNRIRETSGPSPRIEVETKKEIAGVRERLFELTAKRADYLDARQLVRAPLDKAQVVITLTEALDLHDVECTLRFTARHDYFPSIRGKLDDFAVPSANGRPEIVTYPPDEPEAIDSHVDVFTQSFFLRVKDTAQFDAMVSHLRDMAKSNGFLLDVANAHVGAEFNTNDAVAGIEHVISGNVRPDSALYHVEPNRIPKRGERINVGDDGRYGFSVVLAPDVHNAYLVSIYIPPEPRYGSPLAMFVRVDVHTSEQVEIPPEEFANATGITFDAAMLAELSPRWPAARLRAFDNLRAELLRRIKNESEGETTEKAVAQHLWIDNIDRNLTVLRRAASERAIAESSFPFPETREWLNGQLQQAGQAAEEEG